MQQARLSAMRRIACSIEDAADCVTVVVTALLIVVRVGTVTSIDAASKLSKSLGALHLDGGWLAASDVSGTDGRVSSGCNPRATDAHVARFRVPGPRLNIGPFFRCHPYRRTGRTGPRGTRDNRHGHPRSDRPSGSALAGRSPHTAHARPKGATCGYIALNTTAPAVRARRPRGQRSCSAA